MTINYFPPELSSEIERQLALRGKATITFQVGYVHPFTQDTRPQDPLLIRPPSVLTQPSEPSQTSSSTSIHPPYDRVWTVLNLSRVIPIPEGPLGFSPASIADFIYRYRGPNYPTAIPPSAADALLLPPALPSAAPNSGSVNLINDFVSLLKSQVETASEREQAARLKEELDQDLSPEAKQQIEAEKDALEVSQRRKAVRKFKVVYANLIESVIRTLMTFFPQLASTDLFGRAPVDEDDDDYDVTMVDIEDQLPTDSTPVHPPTSLSDDEVSILSLLMLAATDTFHASTVLTFGYEIAVQFASLFGICRKANIILLYLHRNGRLDHAIQFAFPFQGGKHLPDISVFRLAVAAELEHLVEIEIKLPSVLKDEEIRKISDLAEQQPLFSSHGGAGMRGQLTGTVSLRSARMETLPAKAVKVVTQNYLQMSTHKVRWGMIYNGTTAVITHRPESPFRLYVSAPITDIATEGDKITMLQVLLGVALSACDDRSSTSRPSTSPSEVVVAGDAPDRTELRPFPPSGPSTGHPDPFSGAPPPSGAEPSLGVQHGSSLPKACAEETDDKGSGGAQSSATDSQIPSGPDVNLDWILISKQEPVKQAMTFGRRSTSLPDNVISASFEGALGALIVGSRLSYGRTWDVYEAVWRPHVVTDVTQTHAHVPHIASQCYEQHTPDTSPARTPQSSPSSGFQESSDEGSPADTAMTTWSSGSSSSETRFVFKICIPGQTRPYRDYDGLTEQQLVDLDHSAVLNESRMYTGKLLDLQGSVVPRFHGLWKATLLGQEVFGMLLNREDTALSIDKSLSWYQRDRIVKMYAALHLAGVVHGDVEPRHIVGPRDSAHDWKLIDFDRASEVESPDADGRRACQKIQWERRTVETLLGVGPGIWFMAYCTLAARAVTV